MEGFANMTNVVSINMPYIVSKKIVNTEFGTLYQKNQVSVYYFL